MVYIEKVYVTDLFKKHNGKALYNGFYSMGKEVYQDDNEVTNESIVLNKEALRFLPKIIAILMDDKKI